jgi:hypothetical protein
MPVKKFSIAKWPVVVLALSGSTLASAQQTGPLVWDSYEQVMDVNPDGSSAKTVVQVVRPLTAEGVQAISMIPFPVSKSLQRFELLQSWVETAGRRRIPLDPRSIITQAPPYAAQAGTLSDIELKVLPIPQLALGGTLHLAVRITQHKPYFPGRFFDPVVYLPYAPRQQSSVTFRAPASMNLKVGQRDWTVLPLVQEGDRQVQRFTLPAQSYRPPQQGVLFPTEWAPYLVASNFADWADVARSYQSRANAAEVPDDAIRALAGKLIAGLNSDRDKARAITDWVRDNIRYVNIALDLGGFVPAPATEVLAKGFGDCKGHVALAIALLRAAGVDAEPALVNLTDVYAEPLVPHPAFNHVVVHLPTLNMVVDTTARYARFGEIHAKLQDKFALLTRSGKTIRTSRAGDQPNGYFNDYELTLDANGIISGTTRTRTTGAPAVEARATLAGLAPMDKAKAASEMMSENGAVGSGTIAIADNGDTLEGRFALSAPIEVGGTVGVQLPYAISFYNVQDIARGGGMEPNSVPWPCEPTRIVDRFRLMLPTGVKAQALPKPMTIDSPLIRYSATYKIEGQSIIAIRDYESRYPSNACTPEQDRQATVIRQQIARDVAAQIILAPL